MTTYSQDPALTTQQVPLRFVSFDGPVWRILPQDLVDTPAKPARAPKGRFHHSGQVAAYASLSVEGASVAIQRYLSDGVSRVIVPMWLRCAVVADLRGNSEASVVWQELTGRDTPSPTWVFSDGARDAGAHALLYSSRSRPDLTHVVVFQPTCLQFVGPAVPYTPNSLKPVETLSKICRERGQINVASEFRLVIPGLNYRLSSVWKIAPRDLP